MLAANKLTFITYDIKLSRLTVYFAYDLHINKKMNNNFVTNGNIIKSNC